jgi:hypothetical protein
MLRNDALAETFDQSGRAYLLAIQFPAGAWPITDPIAPILFASASLSENY